MSETAGQQSNGVPQPVAGDVAAATTAIAPAPSLTAYEKRKQRELERTKLREERKAKREARQAEHATQAAKAEVVITRTDHDRARDAAVFLSGVWLLVRPIFWLFGYSLDAYDEKERAKDGESWVPLARRWAWFDSLITWIAAPVVFVARVADKLRSRKELEREKTLTDEKTKKAGTK